MGKQNLKNWNKVYRLSVDEDQTHKRIRSYRFTRLGILVSAVVFFLAIVTLLYSLIAFTPLRTTIPGYPDAHFRRQAVENAIRIDSLESTITRWKIYADNLSRVLAGQETLEMDSLIKGSTYRYLSGKSQREIEKQDSILRATVRQEEQFGVSGHSRNLSIEGMHFFTPVKGVLSKVYDKVTHPWIDISASKESVVSAALDGTVIFTDWDEVEGCTIALQHPGDVVTIYKHNSKLLKSTGESVRAGSPIALVGGSTSASGTDHLRFELWYKAEAVDPCKYINLK